MLAGCDVQIEQRQLQSFLWAACVSPFWHPEAAVLLMVVGAEWDAGQDAAAGRDTSSALGETEHSNLDSSYSHAQPQQPHSYSTC